VRDPATADTAILCGACGATIKKGERYQLVRMPVVNGRGYLKRNGKRCLTCADDSPELQREPDPPKPLGVDFTAIGKVDTPLTRDWRSLKAGRDSAA